MIALVPGWAHHYEDFWAAIRARNLWFIKIRYAFSIALAFFLIGGELVLNFGLSDRQIIAIASLSGVIFIYNVLIHYYRKDVGCIPGKFNCLHLSLVQMLLDLTSLLILIYYTGAIESPLYLFAIFQTIIGSLILPGYVVYSVAGIYLMAFSSIVLLQHFNVLHSHFIAGLYNSGIEHTLMYIILFILLYSAMILMSVYIANKISHQLYKREQQLRSSLEEIQRVEETKQKYIIGVVHEIKTPISAILSFSNILLEEYVGPLPEKIREKVERIKVRSNDALTLVNNVLYISRLKLLNLTSSEAIEIIPQLETILDKHSGTIKNKNINVVQNDNRNTNKSIMADRLLFELALSNIISNAVKYSAENGVVQIDLNDDENNLTIDISDTGIGIPETELQSVLSEFYRASNAKRSDFEGSGLGLALVREVIERHNGTITINSPSKIGTVENPGTTVTITLPFESSVSNGKPN